ncbi:MAG: inner membrane CreD family protein [Chloroflexi bacterium]|nr:inner membrane CreD family protein [Chloroflexota bacterium]
MKASTRIFGMLVWLGALVLAGSIILALTAARVGEHRSSTYGYAYSLFQQGWGGEIGIVPPVFSLERKYKETQYNKDAKQYEEVEKTERYTLVPKSINIDTNLDYAEKIRSLLVFNAFEVNNREIYTIVNNTQYAGALQVKVSTPENANLLYDYTIAIPSKENLTVRPIMNNSVALLPVFAPGEEADVVVTYSTKGMDIYKYNLSAYQNNVIQELTADIKLNTDNYAIYREGIPHTETPTADGAVLRFDVKDFSTTQDLGVAFLEKQQYLNQIQNLMRFSPLSLALFLLVVFMLSQIFDVRFNAFHFLFLGMIDVFYYLFVAYLIRFFGIVPTFGISIVLTAVMFVLYAPNVLGRWFAFRVAGVYLFLLTVVFSLIFLMPIFQGLLFVLLIFVIFMSLMIFVGRSDISKWHIVAG